MNYCWLTLNILDFGVLKFHLDFFIYLISFILLKIYKYLKGRVSGVSRFWSSVKPRAAMTWPSASYHEVVMLKAIMRLPRGLMLNALGVKKGVLPETKVLFSFSFFACTDHSLLLRDRRGRGWVLWHRVEHTRLLLLQRRFCWPVRVLLRVILC